MQVIPAIDLIRGKVVRLIQGDYDQVAVYSKDPAHIAQAFVDQGAKRLHVVDLDGAREGKPVNTEVLRHIVQSIVIPVEIGGGLRTIDNIAQVLDAGAKWAILGTKACEDLDFIKAVVSEFGEKIIVSIDVKDGRVATRGWLKTSDISDVKLIKSLLGVGVSSFVYTDISRDGMLSGLNIDGVRSVLDATGASMVYSGGVSSEDDVRNLKTLKDKGLTGIIIGKALYENKIDLNHAQSIAEDES